MPIFAEHVDRYLQKIRPERSPVYAEMEEIAVNEHVPIVHWETGRFLAALVRTKDPRQVLEVGTAIGYSTLHMAEALPTGKIITIERDPHRVEQATDLLTRAGVIDKVRPEAMSKLLFEGSKATFLEDAEMLEAVQRNRHGGSLEGLVDISADAAQLQARRMLSQLIAAEAH